MSKILIVEDDISIQALLHDFIQEAGHSVVLAADGVEALAKYSEQTFDLVLLDIMLPKIDGYGVCEVIRQKSNVPIIMLTALDNEENQIKGLDLQADDYITKPFSMPVLLRKIAAVLRRSSRQDDVPQTISYKDLTLDLDGYKVYNGQESIDLTPREFEILRELLTHKGRILTRQNLLQTLWKYEFFGEERTARVNEYAPLGVEDSITNTATITGGGLTSSVTATETINASPAPQLAISKSISPTMVAENGTLTYTLTLQNRGNTAADAGDELVITDTFDPILKNLTVRFNGTLWTQGVHYTYDETTGTFATVVGALTVPAATFTQDAATGVFTVDPGTSELTITGSL